MLTLSDLRAQTFDVAKRRINASYAVHVLSLLAAIVIAVWPTMPNRIAWSCAAGAILIPLAGFYVRRAGRAKYSEAERLRVMEVVWHGLGHPPTHLELAELTHAVDDEVTAGEESDYFDSQEPPGARRLAECVQEAAFYSRHLATYCARWAGFLTGLLVVLGIFALWVTVQLDVSPQDGALVARVVGIVLVFTATGDLATTWRDWRFLAQRAEKLVEKADKRLREAVMQPRHALLLMDEYNRALATASPIPSIAHRLRGESIERAWRVLKRATPAADTPT